MKAKTILFTVIALLFLAGGAGCEKEKDTNENIRIKHFSYTGCKEGSKIEPAPSKTTEDAEEYIEYKAVEENFLLVNHVNAVFNCCPDTIKATTSLDGGKVSIVETETGVKCDCICEYDLEYKVGPLSSGKYVLIFSRDTNEYLRFTIDFNSSLEGKIIVQK